MRVRWGACCAPALVVVALVLVLVFGSGRPGACVPALVASYTILLMLARWAYIRAYAHTRIHAQ